MRTTTVAVFAAALISTASAGTYFVDNYCNFTMYLVSSSTPAQPNQPTLMILPPNTTNAYSEVMRDAGKLPTPSEPLTSSFFSFQNRISTPSKHPLPLTLPQLTHPPHRLHPQRANHLLNSRPCLPHASNLPPNHHRPLPRPQLLRPKHHLRRPAPNPRLPTPHPTRRIQPQLPTPRPRPIMPVHLLP